MTGTTSTGQPASWAALPSGTSDAAHRYQRWSGRLSSRRWTWLAIAVSGIRHAFAHAKTRTLVTSAVMLVIAAGIIFFLVAQLEQLVGREEAPGILNFTKTLLGVDLSEVTNLADYRTLVWRTAFIFMLRIEVFWVLIIVARVGPGLIADDLKARALPIYFSKPLAPLTYILGKWLVVATFIGLVLTVPNLLSLIVGTMLTGGLQTWGETFGLGLDLAVSGFAVMVVGGWAVLAMSSMTSDKRYATVGWLAICLLPATAQAILDENLSPRATEGLLGSLSLRDNVLILTEWLFDLRSAWAATSLDTRVFEAALMRPVDPLYPALVLLFVTVLSMVVCYRRVVRFSRAASNL